MMRPLILLVVGVLAISGCGGPRPPAAEAPGAATIPPSTRGPGLHPIDLATLALPVRPTLELTHVTPAAFAQALGKDPARIFEFVRDNVAYESYAGILRGPRGTLLAMAGNSADRALLLGSMLAEAGIQVRYVRGALPEADARALVASMWTPPTVPAEGPAAAGAARDAVDVLVKAAKRDVDRIRGALTSAAAQTGQAITSPDALVAETRRHLWVQALQDGRWTDLDPTFVDSTVGRSYTQAEETLSALPANLYHRVTVRITAEISDGTRARTQELAVYSVNAADLSGVSVLLVHVPENWQGPVRNIQGALSAVLSDTGRIKPVLLISGQQPIIGAPFPVKVNTAGLGGIGGLLSGGGTRRPIELATAERVEFTFQYPDGRMGQTVREVFDLVGPAKRGRNEVLTQEELGALASGERTKVLTTTVLNILFTTGRLDGSHLAGLPAEPTAAPQGTQGSAGLLRRLAIAFFLASDALFETASARDGTVVRFYPDTPRVFIDELSTSAGQVRLAIDLRRDRARVVAGVTNAQVVFGATVLRGVVDGTLERSLLEYAAALVPGTLALRARVSTSRLLEQADAQRIPAVLVTGSQTPLDGSIPEDARARLLEDVGGGNVALGPQRPIEVAGIPRYAWWRINPRTGETVGVTDDGLHATTTEYVLVAEQEEGQFDAVLVTQSAVTPLATGLSEAAMQEFIKQLVAGGFRNIVIATF